MPGPCGPTSTPTHGPAVLYAWDANDLTNTIYESDTNSARDGVGEANRFAIPVVTNGKLYLNAQFQVDVYGLFNGQPAAAAPVITPDGGTFSSSQSVTLSTTTASATIYYTLDGTDRHRLDGLYRADHHQYRYHGSCACKRDRL